MPSRQKTMVGSSLEIKRVPPSPRARLCKGGSRADPWKKQPVRVWSFAAPLCGRHLGSILAPVNVSTRMDMPVHPTVEAKVQVHAQDDADGRIF